MSALWITSLGEGEGKTALALGLARWLQGQGKRVGYLRPGGGKGDAPFARQVLFLEEPPETLSLPLLQGYSATSANKDLVLIEGGMGLGEEARRIGAKVLLVTCPCHTKEEVAQAAAPWAGELVGVVVNAVPRSQLFSLRREWGPFLEGNGLRVLGFIPEDRTLFSPSVAEVAQHLGGNIINHPEKADELVEEVMTGVLWIDPIPLYFGLKKAKAVVARGDRPDVQLGALETPTRCLVLTQGLQPHPYIYYQAEDKGVPIMVVPHPTPRALELLEEALFRTRFHQEKKLPRLLELLQAHLDFPALSRSLGL